MSDPGEVFVGIALIRRSGRYLIRRRPPLPGSPMPGLWEFPGGKCEIGESPEAAAIREAFEEAGIAVRSTGLRRSFSHLYPHGFIRLHYFDCESVDPSSEPVAGSGFRWAEAETLPSLEFPEANGPILRELAEDGGFGRPVGPAPPAE